MRYLVYYPNIGSWWRMKVEVGAKTCLYSLPAILVGALANGKPNCIVITHVGITAGSVSLGMNKYHYTNGGTKMNRTFSSIFSQWSCWSKRRPVFWCQEKTWIRPHVLRPLWKDENCAFDWRMCCKHGAPVDQESWLSKSWHVWVKWLLHTVVSGSYGWDSGPWEGGPHLVRYEWLKLIMPCTKLAKELDMGKELIRWSLTSAQMKLSALVLPHS